MTTERLEAARRGMMITRAAYLVAHQIAGKAAAEKLLLEQMDDPEWTKESLAAISVVTLSAHAELDRKYTMLRAAALACSTDSTCNRGDIRSSPSALIDAMRRTLERIDAS